MCARSFPDLPTDSCSALQASQQCRKVEPIGVEGGRSVLSATWRSLCQGRGFSLGAIILPVSECEVSGDWPECVMEELCSVESSTGSGFRYDQQHGLPHVATLPAQTDTKAEHAQAKGGKQMFGRSWGRLEAELARTLHETFGLVADRLPWDSAEEDLAFRHMPEARLPSDQQHMLPRSVASARYFLRTGLQHKHCETIMHPPQLPSIVNLSQLRQPKGAWLCGLRGL